MFAFGSLVTALAYDLPHAGRRAASSRASAAAAWCRPRSPWSPTSTRAERRGVPLGVVGAVQELGSVLGPLYGAVVLAVGDWRAIFWINLAVGLVLAAAIALALGRPGTHAAGDRRVAPARRVDGTRLGGLLLLLTLAAGSVLR